MLINHNFFVPILIRKTIINNVLQLPLGNSIKIYKILIYQHSIYLSQLEEKQNTSKQEIKNIQILK